MNRMTFKLLEFLLMFSPLCQLNAQRIELPNERICLFSDKPTYKQGDTIQLYGQVLSSDKRYSHYSNYIYVELFNREDSVLFRHKTKCLANGFFSLPIQTDYDCPNAIYYARAYTRLMQNFNPESFPVIELPVGLELFISQDNVPGVKCFFFPEGGQWIDGDMQNITIYLTDSHGVPLQTKFLITNQTDTIITSFSSSAGLQTLCIRPNKYDNLRLSGNYQGEDFSFSLPDRVEGHTLQAVMNRDRLSYRVISGEREIDKERLFIFHPATGLKEVSLANNQKSGIINVSSEDTGLYILLLTDEKADIIAQSVLWKAGEKPAVSLEKEVFILGERIVLQTNMQKDSSQIYHRVIKRGQLSTSAALLSELESELLSPVPFPEQYRYGTLENTSQDIEAWLRTTRFIRFNPAQIIDKKDFVYRFQPEIENLFTGQVNRKSGKPLKGGTMVAYNAETSLTSEGEITEKGRYAVAIPDFENGNYFFLQAHPIKGVADFYQYIPDNDTFPSIVNRRLLAFQDMKYAKASVTYQDSTGFAYQVDELGNRDYIIPEITVKAKMKRDKHISTERFYQINYIDENTIQKRNFVQLEDIFAGMPGLTYFVEEKKEEGIEDGRIERIPRLTTTRGASILKGAYLVVLLDGIQVSLEEVMNTVPVESISSIELLKPWQTNAVTFGAINGALAITTKQKGQSADIASKGFYYYPMGLTQGDGLLNNSIQAPFSFGSYELLIDLVTKENEVYSYRLPFVVQ